MVNKQNNSVHLNTQKKILEAAKKEFCEHGLQGARMKSIAMRAGVNKALLHYYFRSKDKLFETIIKEIITEIWNKISSQIIFSSSAKLNIREIIRTVVSAYINTLSSNPDFPMILLKSITSNDKSTSLLFEQVSRFIGEKPKIFVNLIEKEIKLKRIRNIDLIHFLLNIMGMIIISFLSIPASRIIKDVLGISIKYNNEFYKTRIEEITDTLCYGIINKEKK